MKNLFFVLVAFGCGFSTQSANAQSPASAQRAADWCGTTAAQELYFAEHPGTREAQEALYRQLEAMSALQQRSTSTAPDVTIPVVVHVIHSGGADNISDAQVNSGIAILNNDYQKLNSDTAAIIPLFRPIIGNIGFQFRLAKIDPNGNCTTGITRHYMPSLVHDDQSGAVQALISWDHTRYLNVWVVDVIGTPTSSGYVDGYSFIPPNYPAGRDGFVVRNDGFGNIGTAARSTDRTPTHEIGHYFGLYHPWGNTNNPGTGICTGTDYVADTPTTDGTFTCNYNYRPCGVVANVQNYMDYACEQMFTQGQRALMRNVLQTLRANLTTPANLIATGTNDGYTTVPCAPIAAFFPDKTVICEGGSVTFRSVSYNLTAAGGAVRYAWSFPNGTATPATATTINTTVTYQVAGIYPVTLTVSNSAGSDTHTTTQLIIVTGANSGEIAPFSESFEKANFPNYYPAPSPRNYTTSYSNPATTAASNGWVHRYANGVTAAADSTGYLYVPNRIAGGATSGTATSTLITPNINLSGVASPVLSFSEYYGSATASANVSLAVSFSIDCGTTWAQIATYTNTQLNLTGTTYQSGALPTSPSDWRSFQIPVVSAYQRSNFQVRFVVSHSATVNDDALYFDHLAVTSALGTHGAALAQHGISVYPNPLTNETAVHLDLATTAQVAVSLTDVLGREVLTIPAKTYAQGAQTIALPTAGRALQAGVYLVRISLNGETYTSKLAVQ